MYFSDPAAGRKRTYQFDPHLDPQLVWAGKAEHTSFEVPTVSLRVHERTDPRSIIEANRKRNGDGNGNGNGQMMLFEQPEEDPPSKHWPNLWRIGKPHKVFSVKKTFAMPAAGIVEYQYSSIPTDFREDRWIKAMEARPGATYSAFDRCRFSRNRFASTSWSTSLRRSESA